MCVYVADQPAVVGERDRDARRARRAGNRLARGLRCLGAGRNGGERSERSCGAAASALPERTALQAIRTLMAG